MNPEQPRLRNVATCCQNCQSRDLSSQPFPHNLFAVMIVCTDCGNKRCPKATWHGNDCTGSNKPGQSGSSYSAVGDLVEENQ